MGLYGMFEPAVLATMRRVRSATIGTMAVSVSGKEHAPTLLYGEAVVESLGEAELIFVLRHEVAHIMLGHCNGSQKGARWNAAQDLAINSLLEAGGASRGQGSQHSAFSRMPRDKKGKRLGLHPEDFGYPKLETTETYYRLLEDREPPESGMDAHIQLSAESGLLSQESAIQALRDFAHSIYDRLEKNGGWGSVPGEYLEMIRKAQNPQVPWNRVLRRHLGRFAVEERETDPRKPSRRFGFPWLGTSPRLVGRVDLYVDTSGSVCGKELEQFFAEAVAASRVLPVYLHWFDTQVYEPAVRVRSGFDQVSVQGRGGTDFQAMIDHAEATGCRQVVCFTDGCAPTPELHKAMRLVWVISRPRARRRAYYWRHNRDLPGTVIEVEVDM
jgi:predicted metal-dependent peptidase